MKHTAKSLSVVAVIAVAVIGVPIIGLFVRVPWTRMGELWSNDTASQALLITLQTSLIATALCIVLGVPLAWAMSNMSPRVRTYTRAIVTVPVVLPPVVGGIALLSALGGKGVFGGFLSSIGISLPFTQTAVVLSQLFVAMPFLVLAVEGQFRTMDRGVIDAARVMGFGPFRTFTHVVLPMTKASIIAGAILAWARAVGEFGASITFAGSLKGKTQTLPMAVYELLERDWELAMGLSVVMILFAVAVIFGLRSQLLNSGNA
jgi:molybdate transport system permease protein